MDFSKIKLIASEIDGVITDGMFPTDELGNVLFKNFYVADFEAINFLKKHFIFIFVSKDNSINYHMCQRKNIPFFFDKSDKNAILKKAMSRYGVGAEEVLYIGSSLSDLDNVQMIPMSMCTLDAPKIVKERSYDVIEMYGGQGVILKLMDMLASEINRRQSES